MKIVLIFKVSEVFETTSKFRVKKITYTYRKSLLQKSLSIPTIYKRKYDHYSFLVSK